MQTNTMCTHHTLRGHPIHALWPPAVAASARAHAGERGAKGKARRWRNLPQLSRPARRVPIPTTRVQRPRETLMTSQIDCAGAQQPLAEDTSAASEAQMDSYTEAILAFLEGHKAVAAVRYQPREPCVHSDLVRWEARNQPFKLPADLQAFMHVSNGFSLCWDGRTHNHTAPGGSMCLNAVADIKPVPLDFWPEDDDSPPVVGSGEKKRRARHEASEGRGDTGLSTVHTAFDLDASCSGGRVALMYFHGRESDPEVWFQDLSCAWSFLARSFSDYFRLMLTHVGLPGWQHAFTPMGAHPTTLAWLRLIDPSRLAVDTLPTRRAGAVPDAPPKSPKR